jgi:hypothetical protein
LGRVDDARKILVSAQVWLIFSIEFVLYLTFKEEYSLDWKVYLELVLLEIRANDLHKAMKEVKISLEVYDRYVVFFIVFSLLSFLICRFKSNLLLFSLF